MFEPHARHGRFPWRSPNGMPPIHPTCNSCHTIHSCAVSQANILVDKDGTPHIAGLSNASILPHSTVEGARTSADRLSRRRAPELIWPGTSPNANDPTHPTDASDMYAFAVMAWEVCADSFVWN